MQKDKYCFSLAWLETPKGPRPVLPLRGAAYFAAFIGLILLIAFFVDRELGVLAGQAAMDSKEWQDENRIINQENYKKIQNSPSQPLFTSLGYAPDLSQGRQRILVLGDSFIWGDGHTNINTIWWRQLQWELERRGYNNLEVVAAGTNGASTQDHYSWLNNNLADNIHPSAVIFGYVTNDPQIKDASGNDLVKQLPVDGSVDKMLLPFEGLLPNLSFVIKSRAQLKQKLTPDDTTGYPYQQWELKLLEGKNFDAYKNVLKQLSAKLSTLKVPTFFVTTPSAPNQEYFEPRYQPVSVAMRESGLEFVDLLPTFLACCGNKLLGQLPWAINPANGHPGPRATYFYAQQVANLLETKYPESLGQRSAPQPFQPRINDWLPASLKLVANGEASWEFLYPNNDQELLFMPVKTRHIAVNFERPVSIKSIQLVAGKDSEFTVWAKVLNEQGHYEMGDYILGGNGQGPQAVITLPASLAGKRITSLRIAKTQPTKPTTTQGNNAELVKMAIEFNLPGVRL
ncbi:MAG: SGNH/GDSL hydrolase family protein [Methylococcales bacterium]|nr:SGNH/GDSL hydrolase family protein [Methylococcales bacterium]